MLFLNFLFLSTTFHFSMNYFFKEKYQNLLYSLSYIVLYNYGKVEILLKNSYNKVVTNKSIEYLLDKVDDYYKFFKTYDTDLINNNILKERGKMINVVNNYDNFLTYDLIIYKEEIKKCRSNKVIFGDMPNFSLHYEKCDYQFMSLSLTLKNKNHEIIFCFFSFNSFNKFFQQCSNN